MHLLGFYILRFKVVPVCHVSKIAVPQCRVCEHIKDNLNSNLCQKSFFNKYKYVQIITLDYAQ